MTSFRRPALLVPILALLASGCGDPAADTSEDGISIVASTSVYGDIASVIAGDGIEVTSLITSASQDPHEYEATAQDRLALARADIVIENGGGYDAFVEDLLGDSDAVLLTAVDIAADYPPAEYAGDNEHVWYDLDAMAAVIEEIESALVEVDPDHATTYATNLKAFANDLYALQDDVETARGALQGGAVAVTEPVPLYLLEDLGLENLAPNEFSEAVEEGADVPPRALQEMLDLVEGGQIAMLAYNSQAADATTERVRTAAETAGVPVVELTETLPEGQSYLEWQRANLEAILTALGAR